MGIDELLNDMPETIEFLGETYAKDDKILGYGENVAVAYFQQGGAGAVMVFYNQGQIVYTPDGQDIQLICVLDNGVTVETVLNGIKQGERFVNKRKVKGMRKQGLVKKLGFDNVKQFIGKRITVDGNSYRITDVDIGGSGPDMEDEGGWLLDFYVMDDDDRTYSFWLNVGVSKEWMLDGDDWSDLFRLSTWGDFGVKETKPENWEYQRYYYEHYGIEPKITNKMDVDAIRNALSDYASEIVSVKQVSDGKARVEFNDDVADYAYWEVLESLKNIGYLSEWYFSHLLDVYVDDSAKSARKSKVRKGYEEVTVGQLMDKLQDVIDELSDYDRNDKLRVVTNTYFINSQYYMQFGSAGFIDLYNIEIDEYEDDEYDEDDDIDESTRKSFKSVYGKQRNKHGKMIY